MSPTWNLVPSPAVSVVVPCLNEADHVERLLDAVRLQDQAPLEIVVVDDGSTDGTQAILDRYRARHPEFPLTVITLPPGDIPVSLNAGIRRATGDVIVRLDAHSCPRPDYLRRVATTLQMTGAGGVGGRWEIEPGRQTVVGHAIAWAVQHPLGAGDTAYRVGGREDPPIPVDTVPYGCFEKSLWEALGGFNERLLTNEDYEFNYRVRCMERPVLFDPSVVSTYVARGDFLGLARQYFRYGWWKAQMLTRHPRALRWRQAIPVAFVSAIALLGVLSFAQAAFIPWLMALGLLYLAVVTVASVGVAWQRREWKTLPVLPLVFATIHFAWVGGALSSLVTLGRWPRWR